MSKRKSVGFLHRRRGRFGRFWTRNKLKLILAFGDATAVLVGYLVAAWGTDFTKNHGFENTLLVLAISLVAALWALRAQGLYRARVSAIRVVELTRTARAVAITAAVVLLGDRILHIDWHIRQTVVASVEVFVFLSIFRSVFRTCLSSARERGKHCRRIVIVGTDDEAVRLINLFQTHRNLGLTVVGVLGNRDEAERRGLQGLWIGDVEEHDALMEIAGLSGVITSTNGVSSARLNSLIRELHQRGLHVHLATGIAGIDVRRLRSVPLAHEPLLYVEAPSFAKTQLVFKRCFDIVVSSLALIVLSPVFLAIAIAIKLDDRGPTLFSQSRVGRSGRTFGVLKFRSMVINAEGKLAALDAGNERQGPLFKMENDPRVTRVGRLLRASSLDELPQLWNVLRGEMSLVGPRPALPAEVVNFPSELKMREQVMPGITGLWQVEARDNPSFEAYRRLDLFYVEN